MPKIDFITKDGKNIGTGNSDYSGYPTIGQKVVVGWEEDTCIEYEVLAVKNYYAKKSGIECLVEPIMTTQED